MFKKLLVVTALLVPAMGLASQGNSETSEPKNSVAPNAAASGETKGNANVTTPSQKTNDSETPKQAAWLGAIANSVCNGVGTVVEFPGKKLGDGLLSFSGKTKKLGDLCKENPKITTGILAAATAAAATVVVVDEKYGKQWGRRAFRATCGGLGKALIWVEGKLS